MFGKVCGIRKIYAGVFTANAARQWAEPYRVKWSQYQERSDWL
jgi:hypothetical protein